jgi:hypothetical protein
LLQCNQYTSPLGRASAYYYYVVLGLAAAILAVADFKLEPLPSISLPSKQASTYSTWELNQASA